MAQHEIDIEVTFQRERELAESFAEDVEDELRLHDAACALLAHVVQVVGPISAELPANRSGDLPRKGEDTPKLLLATHSMIGARALGAIRAARADLSIGREFEAQAQVRVLFELMHHRDAIVKDDTGVEAWRWLTGRRSLKIRDLTPAARELYANLCDDSHGGIDTIKRLLDPEDGTIDLSPKRTHRTRATLLANAGTALDQAAKIVEFTDKIELGPNIAQLSQSITACWNALVSESDREAA